MVNVTRYRCQISGNADRQHRPDTVLARGAAFSKYGHWVWLAILWILQFMHYLTERRSSLAGTIYVLFLIVIVLVFIIVRKLGITTLKLQALSPPWSYTQ